MNRDVAGEPRLEISTSIALAAFGLAGIGAAAGFDGGVFAVLHDAAALPLVLMIVTGLLLPALYIGSALAGFENRPRQVVDAILFGLRASGIVALGLVLPLLFLVSTTDNSRVTGLFVAAALFGIGCVGLRATHRNLLSQNQESSAGTLLFLIWALTYFGITARLMQVHLTF